MGSSVHLLALIFFALTLSQIFSDNNAQFHEPMGARLLGPASLYQQQDLNQVTAAAAAAQSAQVHQQASIQHQASTQSSQLHSLARLCAQLSQQQQKQLKLCKLIQQWPGAEQAVALGAAKGIGECRDRFRSERWNCTHAHGEHHLLTSKLAQSVGNRESAFVQAIAAAGIVYSVALACSSGSLADCECDKTRVGLIRQRHEQGVWKWGGCSNNVRHGMLYAKHLVELLDAVHRQRQLELSQHLYHHHHQQQQQPQQQQQQQQQQVQQSRRRRKRALSSKAPNLLRVSGASAAPSAAGKLLEQHYLLMEQQVGGQQPVELALGGREQQLGYCQNKSGSLTQAAHLQLVRSLLNKNSLEKHQDFRLAMNMHNNRVGRMAVAKNMEVKCRCHGLSGSCSLKTCWLALPDFKQIGAYLRHKYNVAVHLPSAVSVNKLLPLMDRHEVSSILAAQSDVEQSANSNTPVDLAESAPLQRQVGPDLLHFSFYERHKQLAANRSQAFGVPRVRQLPAQASEDGTELARVSASLVPLSQQQFHTLLRDLRLCATNGTPNNLQHHGPFARRDVNQQRMRKAYVNHSQHNQQQSISKAQQHLQLLLHNTNSRDELVHLHHSPDYCSAELHDFGFAGVRGRPCNASNPQAPDSCDKLCCGRGHERREYTKDEMCECKFRYCCSVRCASCLRKIEEFVCR